MATKKLAWKFLFEVLSYATFVGVLYAVIYLGHRSQKYYQVQHLRQLFLNPGNFSTDASKIASIDDYWRWLQNSFIFSIDAGHWYNGQPVNNSEGFLSDKVTRLIGWATMRQLRIKADTCRIKPILTSIIKQCNDGYSASIEQKGTFYPGWSTNATTQNYSSSINQAFSYRTGAELDTYIYVGDHATYRSGGYVYEFRQSLSQTQKDLEQLHELSWIDRQTRAVIIQLNLYNPMIPIYTSVVLIIELLPSSGGYFKAQIDPIGVDDFQTVTAIVCVIIYLAFIVGFLIMEIRSFVRLRCAYFRSIWSYFELSIISCSWGSVGVHFWGKKEANRILRLFRETNGSVYLNFQLLSYINDVFSFLLAFCCFFGTIKFIRLCRYNRRLALLTDTLRRAAKELISFTFMFTIVFMAFVTLFYLQFVAYILDCSSILNTVIMLFEMLLLKFDTGEIIAASPILGPIYFTLFILFIVFVCINMFVSIIMDNFRDARAHVHKIDRKTEDLFVTFFKKLQAFLGSGHGNDGKTRSRSRANVIKVLTPMDPGKRLERKLNELMIAVDRRYGGEMKLRRTQTITTE